jgi:hypothetical protein
MRAKMNDLMFQAPDTLAGKARNKLATSFDKTKTEYLALLNKYGNEQARQTNLFDEGKKSPTPAAQVNAGESVKPPKGATFVRVTMADGKQQVVAVADMDTLAGCV